MVRGRSDAAPLGSARQLLRFEPKPSLPEMLAIKQTVALSSALSRRPPGLLVNGKSLRPPNAGGFSFARMNFVQTAPDLHRLLTTC